MPNVKIILGIVASYFALILVAIIWERYRKNKVLLPKIEDFLLANRDLPIFVLALTFMGSLFSAFTVVGVPGSVFSNGIGAMGYIIFSFMLFILTMLFFGKPLRRYAAKHSLMSPIECVSHAYKSKWLGAYMAMFIILLLVPYLSLQLVGLGKLLEGFSGGEIGYIEGVGFVLSIIAFYMLFGGMRAVAYTDVVQTIAIFVGAIIGVYLFVTYNWGNITNLFAELQISKPEMLSMPGPNSFYTGAMFFSQSLFLVGIIFQPHMLTRMMMAKDDKQINKIAISLFVVALLIFIPSMIFGLGGSLLFHETAPNQISGNIFAQLSTIGIIGTVVSALLFIGVIGASMSTADSLLLSMGQLVTRDLLRSFIVIKRGWQILFARITMVSMLVFSFFIGLSPPQFMIDLAIYSAAGVCAFIPTMVGMFWKRRSTLAAFVSSIFGLIILSIFATNSIRPYGFHEGFVTLVSASLIYVVLCFICARNK